MEKSTTTACSHSRIHTQRTTEKKSGIDGLLTGLTLIALAVSSTVSAQTATPVQTPNQTQVSQEIIVSASRIVREGFTAPTPTTEFGKEEMQARAAVNVSQVLFELPSVRPTSTAVVGSQNSGFNFANLRGLNGASSTRTLVLVDGQRFVPTTQQGLVDMNSVPAALVDRVEVVTGGASASWGSDAVAGVTNFILKKKMEGLVGSIQYGQSQRHDNKETGVNLAWGTSFADNRGQFMIAGEYSKLSDVATQGARAWGRNQTVVNLTPPTGAINIGGVSYARATQTGVVPSNLTFGGVIVGSTAGAPLLNTNASTGVQTPSSPLSGIQFGPGSTVQPFVYGSSVTNAWMVGGSNVFIHDYIQLASPVERQSIFAHTTFDVTPNTSVFADLSHSHTKTDISPTTNASPNGDVALNILSTNAYVQTLPGLAPLRTILAANPAITNFNVGRIFSEFGRARYITETNVDRIALGFDSALTDNWKVKGYATHGETKYKLRINNVMKEANLRAATDAVLVNGVPTCRVNSTAAADVAIVNATNAAGAKTYAGFGADPGCVPLNPFGQGSITSANADYILGTIAFDVNYKQDAGGLSIQGEPFSTWAGAVSTAGGLEYRKESINANSDAVSQRTTFAFPSGGFQFSNPKPYNGSYSVNEAFAEAVVPLLTNLPGVKSLELNAAVRSTDYSTSGRVTSSKVGMTYKPIEDILFRATKSRDNRAPNLFELYTVGVLRSATGLNDFRTGVSVPAQNAVSIVNGYSKLTPELGKTTTYGMTWSPSQLKGLSASIDAYKITVTNAIGNLGAQAVVNACYGAQGVPQDPTFCQFITRDNNNSPTGNIVSVVDAIVNSAAGIKTNGYDMELSYRSNLANLFAGVPGRLTLRALGTRVLSFKTFNSSAQVEFVGDTTQPFGTPKWRWSLSQTYQNGPLTLFLQENFIAKMKINNTYNVTNTTDILNNDIPAVTTVNTSAQYVLRDTERGGVTLFASINNLLDKDPPLNPSVGGSVPFYSNSQFYDTIGRVFKVGVRFTY